MHRQALSILITAAAASSFLGCGGDDGGGTDAGTTPTDTGSVPADAGPDAGTEDTGLADTGVGACEIDPAADTTRDPACPMSANWFRFVRGTVEANGAGVFEAFPQVCVRNNLDALACLIPEPSCEDGAWVKEITEAFRCSSSIVMRATKPTGGSFAATYCDLELQGEGILDLAEPIHLYPVEPAPNLPALGSATAARIVDLQDGLQIEVTPAQLETCFDTDTECPDYQKLGVRKIGPSDPTPCFVESDNVPDAIYAFTVEIDVERQGFPIRIDNDENLAPGTVVDLYVQGALACLLPYDGQEPPEGSAIEEGDWVAYGTATVSQDGMFIEGGRIPCLNWFGYKAR